MAPLHPLLSRALVSAIRPRAKPTRPGRGGTVLVVEAKVADGFVAPGDEGERRMYGWSVTHFLPTQMVERPSGASAP